MFLDAAGQVIPTMVVFSGKSCNHTLSGGEAGFHLGGAFAPPAPLEIRLIASRNLIISSCQLRTTTETSSEGIKLKLFLGEHAPIPPIRRAFACTFFAYFHKSYLPPPPTFLDETQRSTYIYFMACPILAGCMNKELFASWFSCTQSGKLLL